MLVASPSLAKEFVQDIEIGGNGKLTDIPGPHSQLNRPKIFLGAGQFMVNHVHGIKPRFQQTEMANGRASLFLTESGLMLIRLPSDRSRQLVQFGVELSD